MRKYILGIITDYSLSLIVIAVGFYSFPIYYKHINNEIFSIWLTIIGTIGIISFMDMGLSTYLVPTIAKANIEDKENFNKLITTNFYLQVIVSFVFFLIFLVILHFFDDIFSFQDIRIGKIILSVHFIWLIIRLPTGSFMATFRGKGYLVFSNIAMQGQALIATVFSIMLIYLYDGSIFALIFGQIISHIFYMVALLWYFFKRFPFISLRIKYFDKDLARQSFSFVKEYQLLKLIGLGRNNVFIYLIERLTGTINVLNYRILSKFSSIVPSYLGKVAIGIMPLIAENTSAGSKNKILFINLLSILLRISVAAAIFILFFFNAFLKIWLPDFSNYNQISILMLVLYMVNVSITNFIGPYIYSYNEFGKINFWGVFEFIFLVVLSFLLYKKLELNGLLLALLLSSYISTVIFITTAFRFLNINLKDFINIQFLKTIFYTVLLLSLCLITRNFININSYISFFGISSLYGIILFSDFGYIYIRSKVKIKGI